MSDAEVAASIDAAVLREAVRDLLTIRELTMRVGLALSMLAPGDVAIVAALEQEMLAIKALTDAAERISARLHGPAPTGGAL